jgi:hypothetical protein
MKTINRKQFITGTGKGIAGLIGTSFFHPAFAQTAPYTFTQTEYAVKENFPKCQLKGKVVLKRKQPDIPAFVNITADQSYCGKRLKNRALVLGKGRTVENVIVWLENVPAGKPMDQEKVPVISDEKCDFYPKAAGVGKGQKVILRNGDPIYNDFRAILDGKVLFNIAAPMQNQRIKKRMKKCGLVDLYCNVHPWEHALILVCPHPYFYVTLSNGLFNIGDVPEGTYQLVTFHEVLGLKTTEVTLKPDQAAAIEVTY